MPDSVITIDKLLVGLVKLEKCVIALEGQLASASHVTSVLHEQLTAKTVELEMYSRRSCIVFTGLCKEENKNLDKLKDVETLCETGISKEEITNKIDKLHRIGKTNKNNMQDTIIEFKSHSFKEKNYFKRKAIKQRDVKIKPSLAKHGIELLKDANTLIMDNHGTNFLFAYADIHGNLKVAGYFLPSY